MAILPVGIGPQEGGYQIERSLRFNSADSAVLSRTFSTNGTNLKIRTISAWVKRGKLGAVSTIMESYNGASSSGLLRFTSGDAIEFGVGDANFLVTSSVYRDPSAWYHIVVSIDTTQATSSNRIKIYVNGIQVTSFSTSNYPAQNTDTDFCYAGSNNRIGSEWSGSSNYLDGYLSEVNFIDGQALDPTSFGEYNSETGVWQPIAYAGTYGTNGFYLPMTQDQIVEGFNTVLWRGNGSTQRITGTGFSPDFVWIKDRSVASDHMLFDTVRGATNVLKANATAAEGSSSTLLSAFGADGFTVGSNSDVNTNGNNYVAWCWDAGNSTVSNTDGTITSSVRASQTYGFSVVTWTGAGSTGTVGHSLAATPKLILAKRRNSTTNWQVYHSALTASNQVCLNLTNGSFGTTTWNSTEPTSSVFSVDNVELGASGGTYVAYCFAETGYSKFGSYTGNGSTTGPTVTLGWKPAMVLCKRTDSSDDWILMDDARDTVNPNNASLFPNGSYSETVDSNRQIDFNADGFQIKSSTTYLNASGGTYIYAAFKDQREAAFWRDFSGNGNHWQPNNLDFNDSLVDTPTPYGTDTGAGGEVRGNYCTWNPLNKYSGSSIANGNLSTSHGNSPDGWNSIGSTWAFPQTGKWYAEFYITNRPSAGNVGIGISEANRSFVNQSGDTARFSWGRAYFDHQGIVGPSNASVQGTGVAPTYTTGDTISIAFDSDNGKVWWAKNGTWTNSGSPSAGTNAAYTGLTASAYPQGFIITSEGYNGASVDANFGQRPFAYTAPSGFKALCTQNLPDPAIADGSTAFNTVLYAGTSPSTNSVTGVGFQPDLVWVKSRTSGTRWHENYDVLRPNKKLSSNATDAEYTENMTFDADGFTTSGGVGPNETGNNYVGWCWKAGGTGVTNTAGTITSTVSANTTAGFSIATYTGDGNAGATFGHGLGTAPSFVIIKERSNANGWLCYHVSTGNTGYLELDATLSFQTLSTVWNNTSPTSTLVTLGTVSNVNRNGGTYVAYCFAPVAGFSSAFSYTGNGSSDGSFVYLGFRPRLIMIKRTDTTSNWVLWDTARDTYNASGLGLYPNLSAAEDDYRSSNPHDILSNGFKTRANYANVNASGGTYVGFAWAENPFKYSLAR